LNSIIFKQNTINFSLIYKFSTILNITLLYKTDSAFAKILEEPLLLLNYCKRDAIRVASAAETSGVLGDQVFEKYLNI